jgi:S1-C subfamily serine protease
MGRSGWRKKDVLAPGRGLLILAAAVHASSAAAAGQTSQNSPPVTTPPTAPALAQSDNQIIDPADTLDLAGLQQRFEDIAAKVSGSVVAVSVAQNPADAKDVERSDDLPPAMEGSAYRTAEMNPQKLQEILDESTRTVGTGFVIDSDGYILTNEHVIGQADELWVTTADHKVWPAMVVGSDPRADLAVLKIPAGNLSPVEFATAAPSKRGQWTIAMGNPYGMGIDGEPSMSVGVVSALDRSLPRLAVKEDRLYSHLIQTTAEINPGNSGGPLFDIDGRVMGINTAVILPQKQTNGIGFAIPVTARVLAEMQELKQGREVVYGYLGVSVVEPTPLQRASAGASANVGVEVETIEPDSPAAKAGIRAGDIVTQLEDQTITNTDQFITLVGQTAVGGTVPIKLLRGGTGLVITATPIRRPVELHAVTRQTQRFHWRGVWIGPVDTGRGLVVTAMDDNCPLKDMGIHAGSIITTVGGRPVNSLLDLLKVVNEVPANQCSIVTAAAATTQPIK